jgi:hypothetical protein
MKTLIRVLLDLYKLTAAELLAWANAVYAGMNENPAYSKPPVAMADFRTAIDNYAAAITAALDGGKKVIAERNACGDVVKEMLRKLGHYVEANSNGDVTTLLSSGFKPRAASRGNRKPLSNRIRSFAAGPVSGQAKLNLVAVSEAVSYEVRWAPVASGGSPGDWVTRPIPNTKLCTIDGLTPGSTYLFQARALTRSGTFTDWGEPITRICT